MIVWTTQLHISTVNGYPSPVTDGDVIVYGNVTMGILPYMVMLLSGHYLI